MKSYLLITLLPFFIVCNKKTKSEKDNINQPDWDVKSLKDYTTILGPWGICSENIKGQVIYYNVCPSIFFSSDGSGSKTNSDGVAETFWWSLKNKSLTISYNTTIPNRTFPDTNYITIFKEEGLALEILQEKKDCSFYLTKL